MLGGWERRVERDSIIIDRIDSRIDKQMNRKFNMELKFKQQSSLHDNINVHHKS